ncbi:MAG: hypothetical protein KAH17_09015 [Bacteroidales bacterium]|nr:hypothetical protein [Bacteroidales bacterium]
MIRNSFLILLLAGLGWILFQEFDSFKGSDQLNPVAEYYATQGPQEVGAANLVTSVVVTYRGLDTLGEVTILFLTAAIVGLLFKRESNSETEDIYGTSEILLTAGKILVPMLILVGVYIFINGHLTPGGGFQGGAVLASAFVLAALTFSGTTVKHRVLEIVESFSGISFVLLGILGVVLAGGFLDNKIFSLGTFGHLFSAGAIPIIYSLVGLKVGSELSNIVLVMKSSEKGGDHD